jgi:glucosamine--fructose-6-phosphate aminotransferase (isomerizing)
VTGPYRSDSPLTAEEIASQPAMWARALTDPDLPVGILPQPGEPTLVVGCGTSYYIGSSYASARTAAGFGRTRAVIASELEWVDDDETVVVLSRSGTTSDVERVALELRDQHRVVGVIGTPATPIDAACHDRILLDFADEKSVVQTRFATTSLALLRRTLPTPTDHLPADAAAALERPSPLGDAHHLVFLGTGWTLGLAHEAALKCREAAGAWTEAYAVMEYQHGPIAVAGPGTLVWSLSPVPPALGAAVRATGARLVEAELDPMAEVVRAQRVALELAARAGRDADQPRHLSRSVILD